MQGQSEALTNAEIVSDSYEYRYLTNKIIPLKNHVGEDITYNKTQGYRFDNGTNQQEWVNSHVTGSSCYGYTNLVPEFCRAYTEVTGKQVVAVHIAKGSTVIDDWMQDKFGYQNYKTYLISLQHTLFHKKISFCTQIKHLRDFT